MRANDAPALHGLSPADLAERSSTERPDAVERPASELKAVSLKKRYKSRVVVKDVSLDVTSGEVNLNGPLDSLQLALQAEYRVDSA